MEITKGEKKKQVQAPRASSKFVTSALPVKSKKNVTSGGVPAKLRTGTPGSCRRVEADII